MLSNWYFLFRWFIITGNWSNQVLLLSELQNKQSLRKSLLRNNHWTCLHCSCNRTVPCFQDSQDQGHSPQWIQVHPGIHLCIDRHFPPYHCCTILCWFRPDSVCVLCFTDDLCCLLALPRTNLHSKSRFNFTQYIISYFTSISCTYYHHDNYYTSSILHQAYIHYPCLPIPFSLPWTSHFLLPHL